MEPVATIWVRQAFFDGVVAAVPARLKGDAVEILDKIRDCVSSAVNVIIPGELKDPGDRSVYLRALFPIQELGVSTDVVRVVTDDERLSYALTALARKELDFLLVGLVTSW